MEGALLKWALTNHATTVLILIVAYFVLRETFDKRYRKKGDCPSPESYEKFLTKEAHQDKEKRVDEVIDRLENSIMHLQKGITEQIDRAISFMQGLNK